MLITRLHLRLVPLIPITLRARLQVLCHPPHLHRILQSLCFFFFIVTAIYCIINIFIGGGNTMQKIIMKACYIIIVVIGEYFINLNLSYQMCKVYQWQTILFITIVPWLLIFGVMHLFLTMFPGWLSPFSNTFGYLVVKLMGLPELMKLIKFLNNFPIKLTCNLSLMTL